MKKFYSFVIIITIIFGVMMIIIGCNNFDSISKPEMKASNKTPFADIELLDSIANTEGFVNWKVARFFALNELDERRLENSWIDAWLSEYPLVIYNAETGNPRYYEFRVLKDNREVGAISCTVDKGEGAPVQYVLPFVNEISSANTRAVVNHTGKLIDRAYPGRLLIKEQNTNRSIDAATGVADSNEYPVDAKALDVLLNATQEELKLLGIDSDEIYEHYLAVEREKAEQLALFWQEVDELNDKIINMTEEELLETFSANVIEGRSISTSYSGIYTLSDWVDKSKWEDTNTYCGPHVIAFTMLGLGTKSGYPNIPTTNNEAQLLNYYNDIEKRMGKGPKLFDWFGGDSLNGWLTEFTGGRYYLATHWGFPAIVSHDWTAINASIRSNKLPVISLRWPKIEKINGGFHYRSVIGTREAVTNLKFKILWWTVSIPIWWEKEYLMHDNWADGHNWWEGWSLYQFQAASVLKK
jgi:hypothetical protein